MYTTCYMLMTHNVDQVTKQGGSGVKYVFSRAPNSEQSPFRVVYILSTLIEKKICLA